MSPAHWLVAVILYMKKWEGDIFAKLDTPAESAHRAIMHPMICVVIYPEYDRSASQPSAVCLQKVQGEMACQIPLQV